MASRRRVITGVVSAALAAVLVGAYAVNVSAAAQKERDAALARYGGEQVQVCVAVRELAVGESIAKQDVELRSWLVDLVPDGVATSVDDVVGRTVSYPIAANEPVVTARLDAQASSLQVPDGLVAISVSVTDVVAVGGAAQQGSHVDVYSSGSSGTTLLVEDVLVLETSADATASSGTTLSSSQDKSISWVTLAVAPESVEQLVAASKQGSLYFVLPSEDEQADEEQGDGSAGASAGGAASAASTGGAASAASAASAGATASAAAAASASASSDSSTSTQGR